MFLAKAVISVYLPAPRQRIVRRIAAVMLTTLAFIALARYAYTIQVEEVALAADQ